MGMDLIGYIFTSIEITALLGVVVLLALGLGVLLGYLAKRG